MEAEGEGLNPAANNFAASVYVMAYPIFDPLAYIDTQGNWVPYLQQLGPGDAASSLAGLAGGLRVRQRPWPLTGTTPFAVVVSPQSGCRNGIG